MTNVYFKVQPPPRAGSQAPQMAKPSLTASSSNVQGSGIASPGFMENGPLPSPSPVLNQLTTISNHATKEPPDLGKFPLLRRRRGKNDKHKSKGLEREGDGHVYPELGGSETGTPQQAMMASPAALQQATYSGQKGGPVPIATGEETMRHAMRAFHGATAFDNQQNHFRKDLPGSTIQNGESGKLVDQVSQGTVWPENKKASLAAMAKHALESRPANAGKTISMDEIRSILDKNPSYDHLCTSLESKGFALERAEFARALLSAVPDTSGTDAVPNNTPTSAKKSSRRKDDDSPRRPRGRPRKDLLPPQQHQGDQVHKSHLSGAPKSPIVGTVVRGSHSLPEGYSMALGASYRPPTTTNGILQDPQDQNLAAALQSAITEIDGQSSNQVASNNFRPELYKANGVAENSTLNWAKSRHLVAESFTKKSEVAPLTGKLINDVNSGFGPREDGGDSKESPIRTSIHSHPQPRGRYISPYPGANQSYQVGSGLKSTGVKSLVQKPLTKEQMARKRDFNEIVDLTRESDEELAYQRKRARLFLDLLKSQTTSGTVASEDEIPITKQIFGAAPVESDPKPKVLRESDLPIKPAPDRAALQPNTPMLTSKPTMDLSRFKATTASVSSEREALRSAVVVKELNRNDAVKRSTYNVKTLARDILISRGIHPTERPLNWHLEGLRHRFRTVTNTSDLSTFRWDLVDPGGPDLRAPADARADAEDADDEADGPPKGDEAAPSSASPRNHAVKNADGKSHMESGKINASTTLAPLLLTMLKIATPTFNLLRSISGRRRGRPPGPRGLARLQQQALRQAAAVNSEGDNGLVRNARPSRGNRGTPRGSSHPQSLNSHLSRQANESPSTINNNSNTVEMYPPMKYPLGSAVSAMNGKASSSNVTDSIENVDREARAGTSAASPLGTYGGFTTSLTVRVPKFTPSPTHAQDDSANRRGRPPGSGHRSSIPEPSHDRSPGGGSEPRRRGRPPGSKTSTPTRGRLSVLKRPVSYRTEIPEDGVGVIIPSRSPSTSSQSLSHVENAPEKKSKAKPSKQATLPSFQVFRCRWRGCVAELHNMETLRKHVFKLHVRRVAERTNDGIDAINSRIPCLWLGCEQDGVFSSSTGPPKFGSQDGLGEHVEKKHLQAVAWELGDGPSTHPSGTDSD